MSNVVISFYQPIIGQGYSNIVCYYESLAKVFADNGNNVLIVNMALVCKKKQKKTKKNIVGFNPDLIIAFNNQKPTDLDKVVDCPIVVWDADCLDFFNDKNNLKQNIDRYLFFSSTKVWLEKYIEFGVNKNKLFHIPQATLLKPFCVEQNKNISIIASRFEPPKKLISKIFDNHLQESLRLLYSKFMAEPEYDIDKLLERKNLSNLKSILTIHELWIIIDYRNLLLSNLMDLGLTLYGTGWGNAFEIFPVLSAYYVEEPVYSIQHNEEIYNSSKICLNINHPQTQGAAFSWRVMDIMATNGCLVSSRASELEEFTKGYVNIPFFNTPFEARELCMKLLKEDNYRKDIVMASQALVKEKANLYDRVDLIEKITGVKLSNQSQNQGNISFETKNTGQISYLDQLLFKILENNNSKHNNICGFSKNLSNNFKFDIKLQKK